MKKSPIPLSQIVSRVLASVKEGIPDTTNEDIKRKLENFTVGVMNKIPMRFRQFLNEPIEESDITKLKAGDILTILGNVGVGKTALAYRIAFRYIIYLFGLRFYEKESVRFELVAGEEFIFEMRRSYGQGRAEECRDKFRRSALVFVDDLFSTMITDSVHEEIFHLINFRSAWLLPTIITTNKTLNELAEIDARIPSRLKGGSVIHLDGLDKRLQDPKG